MKLDAVFFDLDGLMIDSESGGITACQKAGAHFGLPAGEVDRYAHLCIGANTRHSRELFLSMFPDISYENFSSLSRLIRRQLQEEEGIPLKEGILPLLAFLRRCSCPAGVVTSTARAIAMPQLEKLSLAPWFSVFTFGDEVTRSKPFPDIYQTAARKLNVSPARCLVLEDSHNGIRAASAAGMIPIMVPDLLPATPEIAALCHRVCGSLLEIPPILCREFDFSGECCTKNT